MKKHQKKRQYTMMDVLLASPTNQMPVAKQIYQLDLMRKGLNALEKSDSPTAEHWRCVSDAINLLETMLEMGLIEDTEGLLKDAVFAMGEAGARAMKGKAIRLSGKGIQACRAVLDDYAAVMKALPERTMIKAYMKTEKRISDIVAGRSRVHDVAVVAI
jgi:hypothetical protein